ncbi:MAG: hypothetical protein IPP09_01865 [Elusimicrobia bacterium]|nr:hypothetical protein [Elusimicrobiota bacterium]MBK7545771.1 hypothetical protein [Elusimicrobiota bacterium]MBK8125381.1 hypothetical protein [Elusimicrobiota bacterium]MBK8423936.1 hypothetical protein [Elusimicrobiota bacterium]MBK9921916.1 hypothetical protein [Elusimicrobiota bacterium]
MITAFVLLVCLGAVGMAVAFRAGVARAEKPGFVIDSGENRRDGPAVARALERWCRTGRITREEKDRLLGFLRSENPGALDI